MLRLAESGRTVRPSSLATGREDADKGSVQVVCLIASGRFAVLTRSASDLLVSLFIDDSDTPGWPGCQYRCRTFSSV